MRPVLEGLRVLVVAGVPAGVLIGGIGSRLAMLLLRVTSPEHVIGRTSDDQFTIGQFTLGGTYALLAIGALVGVIGAGLYQWVAPWLIGPRWFRRLTVGLACGAVVGSMLLHADGVDFTILTPTWLAITAFIAIPAVFGVGIAVAVDHVRATTPPVAPDRRYWVLPIGLTAIFPGVLVALVPAALVLTAWVQVREVNDVGELVQMTGWKLAIRSTWMAIALLGLRAVVRDIDAITAR